MIGLPESAPSMADLVLAAIAIPMVLASVAAALTPVGYAVALGAGSLPASGGIGYALFFHPPMNRT